MTDLTLILGNRNFSSWSMRAWLALKQTGAVFAEHQVWIDEDPDRAQRRVHSPAGRVPVLRHGELCVWDTLAIVEYLAELFPDAGLWPAERQARARARSLCAEMHAGFPAVRTHMPLNCRARKEPRDRGPEVAAEVARLAEMWRDTRLEYAVGRAGGAFLFGPWTVADAFFAPVASRFETYAVALEGPAAEYQCAVLDHPWVREWTEAAAREEHTVEEYASAP